MNRLIGGLFLAYCALSSGAMAQSSSDKASDGDFTGIALITDDPNWYALFQRPETPEISGVDRVGGGERGTLAIIFSNAEPRDGVAKILCDVTAFDPTGSRLIVDSGPCYEGPYAGPNILHPTQLDLSFGIGEDEAEGEAGFEITLRDVHSGRVVELTVGFTQGGTP